MSLRLAIKLVLGYVLETVQVVVISLAIIIPIRYFLIQPFYVKGASMEPNFYDREYLIIDEISYRFKQPQRGDIVVFRYPNDPRQYFIKRIIGLPGETIQIEDSQIKIFSADFPKGKILDESSYIENSYDMGDKTVKLSQEQYFVLGDNRSSSLDSRIFGPVPAKYIIGRVWVRGWPFSRVKIFQEPAYNL